MWYISFHGGSPGINNIQVYHDNGKPHSSPNLLPTGGTNPALSELRGFQIVGDLLYVVNGYKDYSQVIIYEANDDGSYRFKEIFASRASIEAIFHPYDLAFDYDGNCYLSSQDSNVVTGLSGTQSPMAIAPYLLNNYAPSANFMSGTRVASAIGKLPKFNPPYPPNVPQPQGLSVKYTDSTNTRIANSVRGVLCYDEYIFVSDEPANSVKIYSLKSGELYGQIKGSNLSSPVQLLLNDGILYIGSSGNDSVVTYDLNNGVPTKIVTPSTFIDGLVKHISGMSFGPDGNFYAAERKAQKIKMFPPDGKGDGQTIIKDLPDNPEFIMYVPKS